MRSFLQAIIFGIGLLQGLFAQSPERFEFVFKVKYNYDYADSLPNSHYELKNNILLRTTARYPYRADKAESRSDSLLLNEAQLQELKNYCKTHWSKAHYHGLCRALSPVYADLELWQGEVFMKETYAPCRKHTLPPSFKDFRQMLDRFFDSASIQKN